MPVRIAPFRAALHLPSSGPAPRRASDRTQQQQQQQQQRRLFHASPLRRDDIDSESHYETLNVQTNASPQDIKKSFYTLSKTHHPDHNRSDPNASRHFVRISEAYTVLSSPDRRAKYDRDVLRLHQVSSSTSAAPRGSYSSSSGPAGARPASGLSRRRGTFRGPPPSFYRSGGWGAHGAKRSEAHDNSTSAGATHEANRERDPGSGSSTGYTNYNAGGMGFGQEPFGKGSASDTPHFDRAARAAHTRTHARVDEIRARRMTRGFGFAGSSDYTEVGSFFAILAVLGAAIGFPYVVLRGWSRGGKENKKKASGPSLEKPVKA